MTISFKIVGIWIGILFCFSVCPAVAQQIKVVSGRVLNQETKKPFDKEAVFVCLQYGGGSGRCEEKD